MAFTFRQLFNPETQGGGGVDSERGAKEKIDKLDDIKEMEEKYSSVNIDTGEDKEDDGTYTFIGDRGDYELDKVRDDKSGYKLEQKEKPKNESQEKPYTRSKEHREYIKDPNRKEPKTETAYRLHILDKLLETSGDGGEQNNATISSSPMPEKKEPAKKIIEKSTLSVEDLELQKKVQEEVAISRNILKMEEGEAIKEGDSKKIKWVEKKLQDFELSPYGYAQSALERKLQLLQGDRENPENKNFIKEIDLRIAKLKTRLDNLLDSYEKKIPLKLPRNDRTRDFRPDEGLVFDSENVVYILNKYLKENTKSYTVGNAFQKGPAQYVILKTDTGVEKEININKLSEILSEVSFRDDRDKKMKEEKLEKFEKIKSGTIVQIRVGGFNGKETTYKVHEVKNGKVMYENLTEKQKVTVSIDDMRKFLMGKGVEFIVGQDKNIVAKKEIGSIKNEPKNNDVIKSTSNPLFDKVARMETDLGFMNALVIERDLKVSKEEAEKLFSEYKVLKTQAEVVKAPRGNEDTKKNPLLVNPDQPAPTSVGTPEKTGPTAEQLAKLESLVKLGRELGPRIKELESEIQNDLKRASGIEKEDKPGDYAEVLRLVRFQIENPKEVTSMEIESFLKNYETLRNKIYNIELHRAESRLEIKSSEAIDRGRGGIIFSVEIPDPKTGYPIRIEGTTKDQLNKTTDEMYNKAIKELGVEVS